MKASDIFNLYATGKRDFRGENLRGQNFQKKDLSGADFSNCDIRGTNFKNANLTGAKFIKAKAGLQKWWAISLVILSSILSASPAIFLFKLFKLSTIVESVGILGLIIVFIISALLGYKNFINEELGIVIVSLSLPTILAIIFQIFNFQYIFLLLLAYLMLIFVVSIIAFSLAISIAVANYIGLLSAVSILFLSIIFTVRNSTEAYSTLSFGCVILSGGAIWGCNISWRSFQGYEQNTWVRSLGILFASIGGTSFRNANLTDADFTGVTLKNTDLRAQSLTRTCFKDTIKLNLARVGKTLLSQPAVRDLLINPSIGYKKDYFKADLRGANLDGASMKEANLKQADLSEASLKGADLSGANLTEVNAINTDFTRAYLTGACLEAWNINTTTKLDNVDCQYVFLLEHFNEHGSKERRPSSGDFQPGEFTKLFEEVFDTVDLIFRNGIDWKAFIAAMKQVQVQNEDTPLEIQSIENKGDGVFVVKVNVPPSTNKEKIHQDFNQNYQLALATLEAKYKAQLDAKENEIAIYREKSADLKEIIALQATRPINVEAKAMTNSSDSSKKIEAGRDVTISDSVVNLADTISEVTNAINQLPDATNNKPNELKSLLQQLQTAIASESNLDDDEKAEALTQVKKLADLGKTPEDESLQKKAKKAVSFLEIIAKGLEPATKLAQACKNVLPLITGLLGL